MHTGLRGKMSCVTYDQVEVGSDARVTNADEIRGSTLDIYLRTTRTRSRVAERESIEKDALTLPNIVCRVLAVQVAQDAPDALLTFRTLDAAYRFGIIVVTQQFLLAEAKLYRVLAAVSERLSIDQDGVRSAGPNERAIRIELLDDSQLRELIGVGNREIENIIDGAIRTRILSDTRLLIRLDDEKSRETGELHVVDMAMVEIDARLIWRCEALDVVSCVW